uniref:Odorant-binding protein n=1 Tax=Galeruca daurica TaxID=1651263 RepID=A0A1U9W4Z5_9CUCU|nr:odorant-binding protein [Galeruca daurica]
MSSMKYIFLSLCLFFIYENVQTLMTEKQIAATKKLIRNTCINKQGVAPEKVDGMYKGEFDFSDKNSMCYVHCVLTTYKLIKKDNTFDWEEGISVMQLNAPPSIATPVIETIKNCKNAVKTTNHKCTAALEIAKCLYDDDPVHYFLP